MVEHTWLVTPLFKSHVVTQPRCNGFKPTHWSRSLTVNAAMLTVVHNLFRNGITVLEPLRESVVLETLKKCSGDILDCNATGPTVGAEDGAANGEKLGHMSVVVEVGAIGCSFVFTKTLLDKPSLPRAIVP